jgi:biopolymer transport protein ExbB
LRADFEYDCQYRFVLSNRLPESVVIARDLLLRGGPLMAVLLLLSIFALAILLTKLWQFSRARLRSVGFVEATLAALEAGDEASVSRSLAAQRHPLARVLETAIAVGRDRRLGSAEAQAEVARVGTREVRGLESWLRALSSIAHLSPLVGLLGTVLGMIVAFMRIEDSGSTVDPALLSGGIWQALITTAVGLTIAIPSMAAYHFFEGEVDRVRAAMEDAAIRVLGRFGKLTADAVSLGRRRDEQDDHAV